MRRLEIRTVSAMDFLGFLQNFHIAYTMMEQAAYGQAYTQEPPFALFPKGYYTVNQYLYYIYENNTRVGSVWFADQTSRAWLYYIAVVPQQQSRGIGTTILKWIEKHPIVRAAGKITLSVFSSNINAQRLYERLGYRITCIDTHKNEMSKCL